MKKFSIYLLIFISVFAALCVFSCSRENNDGLRFGFTTEPKTLDPLNPSNTADGRSILFNVFEGLIKPNTDGTFMPCIAESWTVEQNGLVYIFIIKKDIFFHDSSLVTPVDIKFSLDTAIAYKFDGLSNIEEVIISADNEISVALKSADPDFLPYLTIGIVKNGNLDREKNIIGTGPFYIESYAPQKNLVLKKFEKYWRKGLPHLEKVTITFFANFDALMTALNYRNIDGAFLTGSMAAQLDHRQFDVYNNRSAGVHLIALNNAAKPLDDLRVRIAINHGIDVKDIIDTAFFGTGTPSGSPIIPGLSVYYNNSLSYSYNPNLARTLLNEAGYNNSNKLSLEITVPSNYTMHVDTAQVAVQQLESIGINASIKLVDWDTWLKEVYSSRNYQATIITLDSPTVSPRGFLTRYHSSSGNNFINFNNAEFDSVFDSIKSEPDSVKRISLYKEAQRIITENAASVYLQDIMYYMTFRSGVYAANLDYPLYVIDFSSIYRVDDN